MLLSKLVSELLFRLDGYARYLLYGLRKIAEILTREGLEASLLRRIHLCLEIFHTTGSLTKSVYLLSSTMEAQAQLQLDLPKGVRLLSYLSLAIKLSGVRVPSLLFAYGSIVNLILGNMIHKAGAGPKPIPHKELSVESLRDAILFAISPSAKEAAKKMSHQIHEDVKNNPQFIIIQSSELLNCFCRMECKGVYTVFTNIFHC
jgi:hypothetical protein